MNINAINSQINYIRTTGVTFTSQTGRVDNKKPKSPVTIKNYHHIDRLISRGARPTEAQVAELKQHGYKHIIDFMTETAPDSDLPEEALWAKREGIQFHWLPFHSRNNPPEEYIDKFFEITDNAKLRNERVFIHCRHGADRTGVFSAIYKLRNYNVKLSDVVAEMFKYGHNANNNPNLIPYVIKYKEDHMKIVPNFRNVVSKMYEAMKNNLKRIKII